MWDPRGVEIEYEAQFAAAVNAYLLPDKVHKAFGPFNGTRLTHQSEGKAGITYVAHVDPSKTGANFAISIGHTLWKSEIPRVVTDYIHVWRPSDFPDGIINYPEVERELLRLIVRFRINTMVFDHYNSTASIQHLQAKASSQALDWHPHIYERPTSAGLNWKMAEIFKKVLHLERFHAPPHELGQSELEHLLVVRNKVSAPTSGQIQTDDVADCLIGMTYTLLHEHLDVFNDLSRLRLSGSLQGGLPVPTREPVDPIAQQFSDFSEALAARRRPRHYNPARGIWRPR